MRKSVIGTSVAGVLDDWLTRGGKQVVAWRRRPEMRPPATRPDSSESGRLRALHIGRRLMNPESEIERIVEEGTHERITFCAGVS